MQKLLFLTIFLILIVSAFAKSPHGEGFKLECKVCHYTDNWNEIKTGEFNHNKTKFPLLGNHKIVDCKSCHETLDFSKAKTDCAGCHTDIHQGTVGQDCARCHTPNTWIVSKLKQIHQQAGFAYIGTHAAADCASCHKSASLLRFDNISTDCYSCHKAQFYATTYPNHISAGYDKDCARCHSMTGRDWTSIGKGFDHSYFPLIGGHNITCNQCHFNNDFKTKLSAACESCHSISTTNAAAYPGHKSKYLKYSCGDCHNTISWSSPKKFSQHDGWFGIYSGRHNGKWSKCTDCHDNDATYKSDCRKCHNFSN